MKFLPLMLIAVASLLGGCSNSSNSSESTNAESREHNCKLIYDWIDFRQDPEKYDFWMTQVSTYDDYSLQEQNIYSKLLKNDSSYDVILDVRKLQYDRNLYEAPPLGISVTSENHDKYSKKVESITEDAFMPHSEQWDIMNSLAARCPRLNAREYAQEFAYILVMED